MFWLLFGFLLYALMVLSERTLIAASPHDAELLRQENLASSNRLFQILEDVKPTLAALHLARLLVNVWIVVYATVAFQGFLYNATWLSDYFGTNYQAVWLLGFGGYAVLAVLLALSFWLIKRLPFSGNPSRNVFILRRLSGFVFFWKTVFSPFVRKRKPSPEPPSSGKPGDSEAIGNTPANAEKREMEMLKSIVKFSDVTVKQVMQPRSSVVAIDFQTSFDELLKVVRESGFSRMPVFYEDFDNVTGILYVKDLVPHIDEEADFEWQTLVRPNVLLVPESKRISELLAKFKTQKMHMAIVVDEYGGSEGIVTMEDILEEVTGDINDEFDEDTEVHFTKLDDFNYLFEGRTLLNDVCRTVGIGLDTFDDIREDTDTLAGLALELHGDIPKKGTEIRFNDFLFTVTAADNRRIEQIKLTLPHRSER